MTHILVLLIENSWLETELEDGMRSLLQYKRKQKMNHYIRKLPK